MSNTDQSNLAVAQEILERNKDTLEEIAGAVIKKHNFALTDVIIVCAIYNYFWEEFIYGLNPKAAKEAQSLLKKGCDPICISAGHQDNISQYFIQTQVDIKVPETAPAEGKVWLVILHERGHTWLPLTAKGS